MTRILTSILVAATAVAFASCSKTEMQSQPDPRLFELRVYYPHPGKLDALHERFRQHTTALFESHGMENIGYWETAGEQPTLLYLLAHDDKAAKEKSWKDFLADPEWQAAYAESIEDGKLVERVESTLLRTTDYSPALVQEQRSPKRFFELRTYKTTEGNLENLDERFRSATMRLFEKHGGENLVYFHLDEGEEGADNTLIYLMAYESEAARNAMFDAFREDPEWIEARAASEAEAGGSLTLPGGVTHQFLTPTDYSKIR